MERLILLVDDRDFSRELVEQELVEAGYAVVSAADGEEAWDLFQERRFDLVISDIQMPRLDGLGLLRRIRSASSPNPQVPVILFTAYGSLSTATAAGRAGATDCFPLSEAGIPELIPRVRRVLETRRPDLPEVLLGESGAIRSLRKRLLALAPLHTPVLVSGEQGTGKDAVVSYLHGMSRFAADPFHVVKCDAGSACEVPSHGGVYLDEVQRLSPEAQAFWRDRILELDRRGYEATLRVLASTSGDLHVRTNEGAFDPELSRLLCRFEVALPPLRQRRKDIPILTRTLLQHAARSLGRHELELSEAALAQIQRHAWEGNLHSLADVVGALAASTTHGLVPDDEVARVLDQFDPVARAIRRREREEREQLIQLLEDCGGNYSRMAEALEVDRKTIVYRLRKHGLLRQPRRP